MAVHVDDKLNIWVDGKTVYFTVHIRDEIDEYGKDTLFVCEIVDRDKSKLTHKASRKEEVKLWKRN